MREREIPMQIEREREREIPMQMREKWTGWTKGRAWTPGTLGRMPKAGSKRRWWIAGA